MEDDEPRSETGGEGSLPDRPKDPVVPQPSTSDMENPPVAGKASSMFLLQTILDSALDPGYREAAKRPPEHLRWWRVLLIAIVVLLLGLGTGIAIRALRIENVSSSQARGALLDQVELKQADTVALQTEVDDMSHTIEQRSATSKTRPPLPDFVELSAGTQPTSGPGILLTLSDGQGGGATSAGVAKDSDIRLLVNVLWQAGAEAISVNEVRLGPATTIRTAGSAILVDLSAIASPYEISAVGDPDNLMAAVQTGASGEAIRKFMEGSHLQLVAKEEKQLSLEGAAAGRFQNTETLE